MVEEAVFEFLKAKNRPFSQNDIQAHLKDYGKTSIVKTLAVLVDENKVIEKVYGKQKIYYISQDLFSVMEESEIEEMAREVAKLNEEVESKVAKNRELDIKIARIEKLPSKETLSEELESIQNEIEMYKSMILSNGKTLPVAPEEFNKVKLLHNKLKRELRKRQSVIKELLDMILEQGYTGGRDELIEEMGLDLP